MHPSRRRTLENERAVDLEAVQACLAGDKEAFGGLVRRWQDRIYGAIFRMVRDRETAADLAQETFLKAYSKLDSFQGGAAFGTWLYSIAVNQVRSEMRRRSAAKNRPPLSLDALRPGDEGRDFDPAAEEPDAVEQLARREHGSLLLRAIDQLAEEFREVIVLREFQGLSYEDIAASLDIAVGTVRSRLHRARSELRERLQGKVLQ